MMGFLTALFILLVLFILFGIFVLGNLQVFCFLYKVYVQKERAGYKDIFNLVEGCIFILALPAVVISFFI